MPRRGFRSSRPRLCAVLAVLSAGAALAQEQGDLLDMDIEQLGNLRVTTLSRRGESLNDSSAAVYVITGDEIRRSGATSLPEALRLAPGVEVARNGSHSWTISIRGFNSNLSDKLLVLIDGRSVYSPLYAGVFWDVQDMLLDDIDRIEVIEGPGGTLWGANAVNGVINIITRSAWDTQGGYLDLAGGREERTIAGFRYGARIGDSAAVRGYAKYFDRAGSYSPTGAHDAWHMAEAGFRADFEASDTDTLMLEGNVYAGKESDLVRGDFTLGTLPGPETEGTIPVDGNYLLGEWRRRLDRGADLRLQVYYDHTYRDIPGDFSERRDTLDADFQHNLALHGRHDLIWGLGLRSSGDHVGSTLFATFSPASRTDQTYSAFLQDKIALLPPRLYLTLGAKLEHNDYTGVEDQPNARVDWLPTQRQTVWAAVARAVRIPARLEQDLLLTAPIDFPGVSLPFYAQVHGNAEFEAEELFAYEAGYRVVAGRDLSFDLAIFDNHYDKLLTNDAMAPIVVTSPEPYILVPVVLGNGGAGRTYGATFAARWRPFETLSLQFQYSRLEFDLHDKPGHSDSGITAIAGNSPENQAAVYSFVDFAHDLSLYAGLRYVGKLANQTFGLAGSKEAVPSYTALDVSLAYRPGSRLRAAVTVQNLNDARHPEFGGRNQVPRSAYAEVNWRF